MRRFIIIIDIFGMGCSMFLMKMDKIDTDLNGFFFLFHCVMLSAFSMHAIKTIVNK